MKQCEPLKEPLHVSEGCAPCPPGLRNRRLMPMEHVGIVTSEPVAGASDLVFVDVRTLELPEIKVPAAVYYLPYVKGGRYQEPPRELKKKKKAKRRQQKQARRMNK